MKIYKNATVQEIIDLVTKKLKVKIAPLSSYKKDSRGIYQIPEDHAYIKGGPGKTSSTQIHLNVYCRNREICKKMHALIKSEGYYAIWINVFGGHKVFWIAKNPTDNFKKYNVYV